MNDDLREMIATHPFAAGLERRFVDVLAGHARLDHYPAGSWLAAQGKSAEAFHLIEEGRCAIEIDAADRAPLVIATVHPGEVLGWSWMFAPHLWHFDVLALDAVTTIAIDAAGLRSACADDHEFGYSIACRLAKVIASRLEATRHQLVDVYGTAR
jgi:CRP/FNR family transcriptional regulator, cyclic AMP receptor protein